MIEKFKCFNKKVIFLPIKRNIDEKFLLKCLKKNKYSEIYLTCEYYFLKDFIKDVCNITPKIVTGCTPRRFFKDGSLVICSGTFYKKYFSKFNVFIADPVSKELVKTRSIREKKPNIDLIKTKEFIGIVLSMKSGQYWEINVVRNILEKLRIKNYDIIVFKDDVKEEVLFDLNYDFYILFCCPRVIDSFDESLKRKCVNIIELL